VGGERKGGGGFRGVIIVKGRAVGRRKKKWNAKGKDGRTAHAIVYSYPELCYITKQKNRPYCT